MRLRLLSLSIKPLCTVLCTVLLFGGTTHTGRVRTATAGKFCVQPTSSRAAALGRQALCSTDEQLPRNAHRAAALNSQGREATRLLAVQSIAQSRAAMGLRAAAGKSAER